MDEKKANGNGERPPARGQIPNDVQDDDVSKDDDRGQHDGRPAEAVPADSTAAPSPHAAVDRQLALG